MQYQIIFVGSAGGKKKFTGRVRGILSSLKIPAEEVKEAPVAFTNITGFRGIDCDSNVPKLIFIVGSITSLKPRDVQFVECYRNHGLRAVNIVDPSKLTGVAATIEFLLPQAT